MNTKTKGIITEIETMLSFARLGYAILTPYGDNERYDFIVDIDNRFYRIQCKTARVDREGTFFIDCCSSNILNGKCIHYYYTPDEIDFLATTFKGQTYLIPIKEGKTQMRLRLKPTVNHQNSGINWAEDYEIEKVIQQIKEANHGK